MHFASDNAGPVHPKIMAALARANDGYAMPYGACDWTTAAVALIREVFDAPEAEIYLVPTGTSANAIALAAMTQPWQQVFCSDIAHIHRDEWGALALYSAGAEMALIPSVHGRMAPEAVAARLASLDARRRGPVSVTQVTEAGTLYSLEDLGALADLAARHGLAVHLDGARYANAVVALGTTAARMAQGISAISFGVTKNGGMGVEALVLRDPSLGADLWARRYRGGHTFSKHRFLAAQIVGYLEDGLWLETAAQANRNMARLAQGLARIPEIETIHPPEANMLFARIPRALHDRLRAAGAVYYVMEDSGPRPLCRLVCDWSLPEDSLGAFLDLLGAGA